MKKEIDYQNYEKHLEFNTIRDDSTPGRINEFLRSALAFVNNGLGDIVRTHSQGLPIDSEYILTKANQLQEAVEDLVKLANLLAKRRSNDVSIRK